MQCFPSGSVKKGRALALDRMVGAGVADTGVALTASLTRGSNEDCGLDSRAPVNVDW